MTGLLRASAILNASVCGPQIRSRQVANNLRTTLSPAANPNRQRPLVVLVFELQSQLRRLVKPEMKHILAEKTDRQLWREVCQLILADPRKHCLLEAFVVAGCCDLLTWSGACDTADASTALESFVARDRLAECLEWDRSLTPTMRAARCGDFCKFLSSAEASFDGSAGSFKKEMDAMGYDIWFWALVSGNKNILNFMRISTPLQRSGGRNVLHLMGYAAPETVDYVLRDSRTAGLVNELDYTRDDADQWGVLYNMVGPPEMTTGKVEWTAVYIQRNRMAHRWATHPAFVSERFNGVGTELDQNSRRELRRLKSEPRPFLPDRSALHYAVKRGNLHLVGELLGKGARVNQRDAFEMTPLHTAATVGCQEVAERLLEHGADRSLLDKTGSTPLDVALDNDHRHLSICCINHDRLSSGRTVEV